MKILFAALALITVIACGKKIETPQIVTTEPVLQSLPEVKSETRPAEILQSRPEQVVCKTDAGVEINK